ncbi:MAG: hypothetical protein Q9195_006840 [Heterodermia aff. obscurata]
MPRRNTKRTPKLLSKMAKERFDGRLKCLRGKAHAIGAKCESKVYLVLQRQGRYYTYNSEENGDWPPSEQQIKCSDGGDHQTPKDYRKKKENLEEYPEKHVEEHTEMAHPRYQELDLDKAVPVCNPLQPPTYVPCTSTTTQPEDDIFQFYEPACVQFLGHDDWAQLGLNLPADRHKGAMDSIPWKAQSRVRSSTKFMGGNAASRDQEHVQEAGVDYSKCHKRKFQMTEESGEDSGLDKRRKLSLQSIYQDTKSLLESGSFSPRTTGAVFRTEPPDFADVQF